MVEKWFINTIRFFLSYPDNFIRFDLATIFMLTIQVDIF